MSADRAGARAEGAAVSEVQDILTAWEQSGIRWVRFELPDLHGTSRSKSIPIRHAADYAQRGLNMYGGTSVLDTRSDVVPGTLYHDETSYADQLLFPDPASAAVLPWMDATARFICDAQWHDGSALGATARTVFRHALDRAHEMGFEPVFGFEYEFYLLDGETLDPVFGGLHIFNTVRNDWVPTIRRINEMMPEVGVDIITSNVEYGGGQWEINFAPNAGIAGPDAAFTFKNGVKEIARQDGYLATFMTKPFTGGSGSGCHTHISLRDRGSGASVFGDADDPNLMSNACRSFIAGQLTYARAIDSLVAPTVNCLKRRRRHTFSPTTISWGLEDRTALIRVKRGSVESTHIEYRAPSALSNPYLAGAALLQAGLQGMEDGLEAPAPSKAGVPAEEDPSFELLPTSLDESLDALDAEPKSKEFFGEDFVTAYSAMRRYELGRYNDNVSDWERNEYLEVF
jgi:glutamine synthetase